MRALNVDGTVDLSAEPQAVRDHHSVDADIDLTTPVGQVLEFPPHRGEFIGGPLQHRGIQSPFAQSVECPGGSPWLRCVTGEVRGEVGTAHPLPVRILMAQQFAAEPNACDSRTGSEPGIRIGAKVAFDLPAQGRAESRGQSLSRMSIIIDSPRWARRSESP